MHASLKRPLLKMCTVLGAVLALALWQFEFAKMTVLSAPALNGIILLNFCLALALIYRNVLTLTPEYQAIDSLKYELALQRTTPDPSAYDVPAKVFRQPPLIGPAYDLIADQIFRSHHARLSATTMQTILDQIGARVFDRETIPKFMEGICVLLGLFGTFVGLMQVLIAVGDLLGGLDLSGGGDMDAMFASLISGLKQPLLGMGTAFSSSLLGLLTSATIGAIFLFANEAQGDFTSTLETWLSEITELSRDGAEHEGGVQTVIGEILPGGRSVGPGIDSGALGVLIESVESTNRIAADLNHNIKVLVLSIKDMSRQLTERADLQVEATRESALNVLNSQDQLASQIHVFFEAFEKAASSASAFNQLSVRNMKTIGDQVRRSGETTTKSQRDILEKLTTSLDRAAIHNETTEATDQDLLAVQRQLAATLERLREENERGNAELRRSLTKSLSDIDQSVRVLTGEQDLRRPSAPIAPPAPPPPAPPPRYAPEPDLRADLSVRRQIEAVQRLQDDISRLNQRFADVDVPNSADAATSLAKDLSSELQGTDGTGSDTPDDTAKAAAGRLLRSLPPRRK